MTGTDKSDQESNDVAVPPSSHSSDDSALPSSTEVSTKSMVPAVLLCFFLGGFGIHRFYVGKIGTGILMILTFGGLGIWVIIDFVRIIIGSFRDKQGLPLRR